LGGLPASVTVSAGTAVVSITETADSFPSVVLGDTGLLLDNGAQAPRYGLVEPTSVNGVLGISVYGPAQTAGGGALAVGGVIAASAEGAAGLTLSSSGFIDFKAPSAFEFYTSPITMQSGSGTNTAAAAVVTTPAVTSGVAFTPNATKDAMVYFQLNAAAAGSYTLTMGPSTGAENTVANAATITIGNDDLVTLRVPAGWKVVLTLTTVTLAGGNALVVTC
jgi:hypothetical protein